MTDFTIDVDGADEYDRRLQRFAAQMADLRSFWPIVSDLFVEWMGEMFQTEGGVINGWARLSPQYAARKAKLRPGKGILVFDGSLKRAATSPRRTAGPQELTLSIDDPKVGWHQAGTSRMPARPLLPNVRLPDKWQRDLERAAEEYVDDVARREKLK